MKILVGLAVFSLLAACCSAQDENAVAEWHFRAPSRGCVEVRHRTGGSDFRAYACDGADGPCIFRPHVDTCPNSALFQKPNLERIVNIRSRDHLVRFYNQIGGACVLSLLPKCCGPIPAEVIAQDEDECRCITLPTGESICDPWHCKNEAEVIAQDEDECRCITLPTGESICDPWHCKNEGGAESDTKALRDLIQKVMMQAE